MSDEIKKTEGVPGTEAAKAAESAKPEGAANAEKSANPEHGAQSADSVKPENPTNSANSAKTAETEPKTAATPAVAADEKNAEPKTGAAVPERAQAIAQDDEAAKAAKRKAAEEARAARAAARAKAGEGAEEAPPPKEPSPNQPKLDRLVQIITGRFGAAAVAESYINELDRHLPCVVVDPAVWADVALLLRDHEELRLEFLRNMTGVDQETHMEVAYYMLNLTDKQTYCVKVKTDRDNPEIPSVASVWETANWNEREIYDLLGIRFSGHPDLRRIMLPDDWVGHPLRKDYEPLDPEV